MVREDRGGWPRACARLRWVAFPKQASATRVGREIGGGGRMWQVKRDSGPLAGGERALGRRAVPVARAYIFRAIDFSVRIQCQRQAIASKPACPARSRAAAGARRGQRCHRHRLALVGSAARRAASIGRGARKGCVWRGGEGIHKAASTGHSHPQWRSPGSPLVQLTGRHPRKTDASPFHPGSQARPVQRPLAQRRQSAVGVRFANLCALHLRSPSYLHSVLQAHSGKALLH